MTEDVEAQGGALAREKGRPTLSPINRRTVPLRVWTTHGERAAITRKAQAARLPVAEFMRRASLGKPVEVVNVPPVNSETRRELSAIGHHLHRIMRAVEASGADALPPDLRDTLASLRAQADALALAMLTGIAAPRSDSGASPRSDFEGQEVA